MPKPFSIQTLESVGKTVYLAEAGGCRAESPLLLTFLSPQEAAGLATLLPNVPMRLAAVSASLWFDGWPEFAAAHAFHTPPQRAYFSVGDTEKNSRNPRLACVEENIRATAECWRQRGVSATFELNPGGHVNEVAQRMARAVAWLVGNGD